MKKAFIALVLLMTPLSVPAVGLDIGLSNDSANIAVLLNPYNFRSGGGSELALGGFFNETGDNLLFASIMAQGIRKLPNQQYNLGAGFKLISGDVEVSNDFTGSGSSSETVGALAIGFKAGYVIPSRQNPVEISLEAFVAPSITSFSNAEMYTELNARVQVEVIPQATAYIGFRRINFDTTDFNNVSLDSSVHLGFKLTF